MVDHSNIALIGAIGGTYICLALMDMDEFSVDRYVLVRSAAFKSPMEAIERYVRSMPNVPNKIGLSVAGQVDGEKATMTHEPWSFDWNDIRTVTRCRHVNFVNEFEAFALAVPTLASYELTTLEIGTPRPNATRAVIGAGTGLGAAALVWTGEKSVAISGASSLASFPPTLASEFDIRAVITAGGLAHAGQVLTGSGLVALYQAMARENGGTPSTFTTPEQVTEAGISGSDELAKRSLRLVATWLGRFAGDAALHYGAVGGVYLAGGMPTGITPVLESTSFHDAFVGLGDREAYLRDVPVHVIKASVGAGLRGAAISLANSLPAQDQSARRGFAA